MNERSYVKITNPPTTFETWYNKRVGEIFEVFPYPWNPKEYWAIAKYEKELMDCYTNDGKINHKLFPNWDFFIEKKHATIVDKPRFIRDEIDRILEI